MFTYSKAFLTNRFVFLNYYLSQKSILLFSTPVLCSVRAKSSYRTTKSIYSNNTVIRFRGNSFALKFNLANFGKIYNSWSYLELQAFVCGYFERYFKTFNEAPRLTPGDLVIGYCIFFSKFRGGYQIDLLFFCSSTVDVSQFSFAWLNLPPVGNFLGYYKPHIIIIDNHKYKNVDYFYSYFVSRRHYIYTLLVGDYPFIIDRELQKRSKSTTAPRKFLPLP